MVCRRLQCRLEVPLCGSLRSSSRRITEQLHIRNHEEWANPLASLVSWITLAGHGAYYSVLLRSFITRRLSVTPVTRENHQFRSSRVSRYRFGGPENGYGRDGVTGWLSATS